MSKLGNLGRVWKTAWREVRESEPDLDEQVEYWESNRPENHDLTAFYETYVWAVYFTGIKVAVIEAISDQIATALREFDLDAIASDPETVRTGLLNVFGHRQKADSVIATALRLHEEPDFWDRLNTKPVPEVLATLCTLPYIGPRNRFHITRNMGWDTPMYSGFTEALAESLGTDCETLMSALAKVAERRVNTTDIVIGMWSRLHSTEEGCIDRVHALLGL